MAKAEEVEQGGVQAVDADAVEDGLMAELAGLAVMRVPLDAAAGHPGSEGVGVVVAARAAFLDDGQAAELAVPGDEGRIGQTVEQEMSSHLLRLGRMARVAACDQDRPDLRLEEFEVRRTQGRSAGARGSDQSKQQGDDQKSRQSAPRSHGLISLWHCKIESMQGSTSEPLVFRAARSSIVPRRLPWVDPREFQKVQALFI